MRSMAVWPVPMTAAVAPGGTAPRAPSCHGSATSLRSPSHRANGAGTVGRSLPVASTSASASSTSPVESASRRPGSPGASRSARPLAWRRTAGEPAAASARTAARYRPNSIRDGKDPGSAPSHRRKWSGSSGSTLIAAAGTFNRCQGSVVEYAAPCPSTGRGSTTTTSRPAGARRSSCAATSAPDAPPPATAMMMGRATCLDRFGQERRDRDERVDHQRPRGLQGRRRGTHRRRG